MLCEWDLTILETKSSDYVDRACEYGGYVSNIRGSYQLR